MILSSLKDHVQKKAFNMKVFSPFGVSLLSGTIVTDPGSILRIVSEGGGMRSFKGLIRKVNLGIEQQELLLKNFRGEVLRYRISREDSEVLSVKWFSA